MSSVVQQDDRNHAAVISGGDRRQGSAWSLGDILNYNRELICTLQKHTTYGFEGARIPS